MVIEGKFFGDPQSQQDAKEQIQAQRRIIEGIILQFPGYEFDRYCHIYLSAESHLTPTEIECHAVLTWEDIKQLSEQVIGANHYVTQRLAKAIDLHQLVFNKSKDTTRKIGQNYRGKLSLSDIVVKCQIEGNDILVGYFGGASALRKANPKTLTNRRFKWDSAKDPIRPKKPQNWIIGGNFLKIVNDGVSDSVGKDSVLKETTSDAKKIGQNYRGKLSLSDIVAKCQIEGNDILVGYFGGASALRKADPKTLTNRRFKWDSAKDTIQPKNLRNWIHGNDFARIVTDNA